MLTPEVTGANIKGQKGHCVVSRGNWGVDVPLLGSRGPPKPPPPSPAGRPLGQILWSQHRSLQGLLGEPRHIPWVGGGGRSLRGIDNPVACRVTWFWGCWTPPHKSPCRNMSTECTTQPRRGPPAPPPPGFSGMDRVRVYGCLGEEGNEEWRVSATVIQGFFLKR